MAEPLHYNDEILLKYVDDEMDPQEKLLFEEEVQKDEQLKERLQKLQLAIATVRQYGTAQSVKSVHSEMMQEFSGSPRAKVLPLRKVIRYSLAVAASIAVLFIGINLFSTNSVTSEKLYSEAFVDFPVDVIRNNRQITTVEDLYLQKNYNGVIAEASKNQNIPDTARLLAGLSYLQLNKPTNAERWFQSLQKTPLAEDGEFYLSLAFLKSKKYNEALGMMEKIRSAKDHAYHDRFTEEYVQKVKKLRSK